MYREAKARHRRPGGGVGDDRRRPGAGPAVQVGPRQGRAGAGDLGRGRRDGRGRARAHDQAATGPTGSRASRRSRRCRWSSHAAGARFVSLIGAHDAVVLRLVRRPAGASPQVFGDQTDVPESGDWWDASYLIIWGSNVPVTRTPDAHWMAEARYRGQKVVVVSPGLRRQHQVRRRVARPAPGTDGALAMAMGHVMLKEFFVDRQVPHFVEYVKRYTDLPFLVTPRADGEAPWCRTSSSPPPISGMTAEERRVQDRAARRRDRRAGRPERIARRPVRRVRARALEPRPRRHRPAAERPRWRGRVRYRGGRAAPLRRPGGTGNVLRRGVPVRGIGGHLVTTVYDLLLAQYGVGRARTAGRLADLLRRPVQPGTPAWQEQITGVPAAGRGEDRAGVRARTPRSPAADR